MAISNSLNSGVNGIKTFSKSLEVIGDNIANVNTTGFKGSRVTNQDSFSQTLREGNPVTNGMQVGSGTSVASISQKFTQGVLSTTGGPTDLGISGSAFFKVSDGTNTFYTRAGDFRLDNSGNLVTNGGLKVQNLAGTGDVQILADGTQTVSSFTINKDGTIQIAHTDGSIATANANRQIGLFTVPNPNGLKREGDNLLSINDASGAAAPAAGTSDIIQGTLELSNVDLTEQFSDLIVAQRSFQANSRIVTVSDSVLEEVVNLKR